MAHKIVNKLIAEFYGLGCVKYDVLLKMTIIYAVTVNIDYEAVLDNLHVNGVTKIDRKRLKLL